MYMYLHCVVYVHMCWMMYMYCHFLLLKQLCLIKKVEEVDKVAVLLKA